MSIHCPFCHSDQVLQRLMTDPNSQASSSNLAASASFATIGASISKSLPLPVSPIIGGIAGAVLGGLFGQVFEEPKQKIPVRYYHCQNCNQNFQ